ncbi:Cytochrome c oxidase assembly protein cox11, mitochondrial, partial [Nowakowskiella sp. JEL0078]
MTSSIRPKRLLSSIRISSNLNSPFFRSFSSSQRLFELQTYRNPRQHNAKQSENVQTVFNYTLSVIIVFLGLSAAAVPLYKIICTNTGLDGTPMTTPGHKFDKNSMKIIPNSPKIKIKFDSSISDSLTGVWKFTPQTRSISVQPGETALAFYIAKNESDKDIVGISTYSVVPPRAAQYFNKIQCFCFEEQKLDAGEE